MNEDPLLIFPTFAKIVGLNQSIILQHLHFWVILNRKKKQTKKNGKTWCYNSYKEWQKNFPFWCQRTIQGIFLNLEKEGLVISANYNKFKTNKTKWYRINYTKLDKKTQDLKLNKPCAMDDANFALSRQIKTQTTSFKQLKEVCVSHETPSGKKVLTSGKGKRLTEKQKEEISAKLELHPFATKALSIWNTLPNVTHHNKPSKTWLNVIKSLNMLKSGKLYTRKFDKDFLKKYNISGDTLKFKFRELEIIITLKKVSQWCQQGFLKRDAGFPTSLPNAIYNSRSFFQSIFLIARSNDLKPLVQKIENKFPETTDYFQKKTKISLRDRELNQLCRTLNSLFEYHKTYISKRAIGYRVNQLFGDFKSMCKTFINWLVDNDKTRNIDKDFKYSVYGFKPDSIMFKKFIKYYEKTLNCSLSPSFSRF